MKYTTLTIQEKLKDLRVERKLTLEELAEQTGISKSALGNYETNDYKDISHYNIVILAKFYGVTADYLLGLSENKNPANADLTDLHLQDETIEILKSGKLNNRLLCEMIGHENFRRLLADVEIYVDNIAGMQIKNLNAWIDVVRQELIAKYDPDKDDPHLRVLEAAHIDDNEYFSQMVHDDIDTIIRDIRAAHKHDSVSAPELSVAELCRKFYISRQVLYALFRDEFGDTVGNYILNKRLTEAKRLLKETGSPISDIARTVGFADYSYFIRLFRKHIGMTPLQYRKNSGDRKDSIGENTASRKIKTER
ncbi:MAG: helix-turn-helix domain-containing protein [Clostridia bacterium]|nr:helix-turn-helix domain-containing protein [Clostridia bacterium]